MAQDSFITDNDDENESLMIHDIARLFKKSFDRRARNLGLTRAQWLAVATVRRFPGICQSELAERLDIEPITAGRTVDRLEKSAWIERRPDPQDRRVKRLYLTDRVKDVVVRMRGYVLETRQECIAGISKEEHAQLVKCLRKIRQNVCDKVKGGVCES